MRRPGPEIVDEVAPPHVVDELPLSDGASVRNVAHAEILDMMRVPRPGAPYEQKLVAVGRYYDGAQGGEPGHYLMLWVEFRWGGSRWRTSGVKIRAQEAKRLARDIEAGKASKPGRKEPDRVVSPTAEDDSELRGLPLKGDGYLIYVQHTKRSVLMRTRGTELVSPAECGIIVPMLKDLASKVA